jgi:hypothetical protein
MPSTLVTTRFDLWRNSTRPAHNHWFKHAILALGASAMLITFRNTLALAAAGEGATFLARARNSTSDVMNDAGAGGTLAFALGAYIPELTVFAAVMFLVERRDRLFLYMAGIALGTAILTTGRVNLLQLFLGLTCVHLMKSGKTTFSAALRFVRVRCFAFACCTSD